MSEKTFSTRKSTVWTLSGQFKVKYLKSSVRTVRFRDFWRQIWEKSIFCQKKKIERKNMKSDLWEVWSIMFLFFKTSKSDINIISWSSFQILKTWNLDGCPDSVRTTVQMSYSKKSLTMLSVVVTHLVGRRYQYQRFGMSFGVKPTYSQYQIDPSTLSAEKIKFQKLNSSLRSWWSFQCTNSHDHTTITDGSNSL